jgi:hypothetical protein
VGGRRDADDKDEAKAQDKVSASHLSLLLPLCIAIAIVIAIAIAIASAFATHSVNASILQPCDACGSFPGIHCRDWLFAEGSWGMLGVGGWIRTFWYRLQQRR